MQTVRVATVKSYADHSGIAAFIDNALDLDPNIAALLAVGSPERLIVIKPNWIQESHEYEPMIWEPVITHPDLILLLIRMLARRMQGRGTICICDAPHTYAHWEMILARGNLVQGLKKLSSEWPELNVECLDLRREVWIRKEEVVAERLKNTEDPRGYVRFNLGRESLFYGHAGEGRYYGADYDTSVVNAHHHGETQEYLIAGTPIRGDIFINLPKMKTHKKTGMTCCLKNLVGINGDKNWLPHHCEGSINAGGDEFPETSSAKSIESTLKKMGRHLALNAPGGTWIYRKMRNTGLKVFGDSSTVIRNGNWSGNDTCWRMALDLNRCLLHGDSDGQLGIQFKPYLAIVDGIIGGEGNGPLCPDPVNSGVLVAGTNPAVVDAAVARLMGFDPECLPIVHEAFAKHPLPIVPGSLNEITIEDYRERTTIPIGNLREAVPGGFRPHFGWRNLERVEDR
jgi:uncharacterized protein (DUF362 family)